MEKPALYILGQAKEVNNADTQSPDFLRDPFTATLNDFIVYCLNELAEVLNLAVVHTYRRLLKKKRSHFFLIGYRERSGWQSLQQKVYGDPAVCEQGLEIKWLLKNLRWYWKKYAEYMELADEAFDDITGFLLFDVVQSAYADCDTELYDSTDEYLVTDCFQASLDLAIAIAEAHFYHPISEEVLIFKDNLEKMLPLVTEFQIYQTKQREALKEPLNTGKVLEFIKCDTLIQELEKEEMNIENPVEKPLTNYFLYTVMPRFESLSITNDSGIGTGSCEAEANINEPVDPLIREAMEMPVEPVVNQSLDALLDSVMNQSDDDIQLVPSDNITHTVPRDPLVNTTMDGSMIVINRYESTPKPKNKVVDRFKKDTSITKIDEDEDTPDANKSDLCEGSFVLI